MQYADSMRETALANVVFLRRMIPFHLCIQTWHSGVSLAAGPVCDLLKWAYLSGRAGRWRSLFSHSRLCSCTVSGWQEAACAALPSDGHGLDLTPYFTKYFLKYFLLGPCSYAIFMPDPAPVYHDLGNLNFSFMENAHGRKTVDFARYLRPVCAALAELGVQASLTGRNDLEAGGRKISGSAQSLRQGRILHHGTLLVSLDFGELVQALHVDPDKIRSKGIASVRSRVANISEFWTPGSGMEDLRAALLRHCADGEGSLEPEVLRAAEELAERKYRSWDWNYGASPAFTLQRRERFLWGLVDWRLDVRDGMVRDCRICGDFFAAADIAGLEERLRGVRCRSDALAGALNGVAWQEYFSHCEAGKRAQSR